MRNLKLRISVVSALTVCAALSMQVVIAHDDVVLVRLYATEEDVAFGKASVSEPPGNGICRIGGAAPDVHRVQLDDFLIDVARELLRRR